MNVEGWAKSEGVWAKNGGVWAKSEKVGKSAFCKKGVNSLGKKRFVIKSCFVLCGWHWLLHCQAVPASWLRWMPTPTYCPSSDNPQKKDL